MRKRGHVIPLRLTDQELAHLNRCAAASGLPREEYLRSLIMGKTITPRPCTHHADLLRKVAGLCNNANQEYGGLLKNSQLYGIMQIQ